MRCSRDYLCEASRRWLPRGLMAASALLLSACAQSQSHQYQSNAGVDAQSSRVAVAAPPRVVMEKDGLPGQHPPRVQRHPGVDDPSEPFSPNYGPPPRPNGHWGQPPVVRPSKVVREATFDPRKAQAIIAQAVAMHELRSQ